MKRTSEINCIVTDCYHSAAKSVALKGPDGKETGSFTNYKESTRVTAEYMGGRVSLNALDPNFKCDIGKMGVLTVEEELIPVRYNTVYGEKNGTGWVLTAVVGFKAPLTILK